MASPSTTNCFIPGTKIQWALDSTSIGYFKTCPRLYYYIMIEGYSPKGEAIHLRFGLEYHQALHDYEKCKATGISHNEAVFDTIRALLIRIADWKPQPTRDSEKPKSKHGLLRTVIWYLDQFKDDPAVTVILANGLPAMELSFKFELDWTPNDFAGTNYTLCGHLDRVVEFSDHKFVMDRKTTTATPSSYYFDQYDPNNQMSLYTLGGKVVLDSPIKGVIIDAAQVAMGFSRFVRGFTYRTDDRIEEWLKDLHYITETMQYCATADYWPQNDTACDKFGGCRFRKICSKSPSVRETFLAADFNKLEENDKWNPLKAR